MATTPENATRDNTRTDLDYIPLESWNPSPGSYVDLMGTAFYMFEWFCGPHLHTSREVYCIRVKVAKFKADNNYSLTNFNPLNFLNLHKHREKKFNMSFPCFSRLESLT